MNRVGAEIGRQRHDLAADFHPFFEMVHQRDAIDWRWRATSSNAWCRRVLAPATEPDAKPPCPFVSCHSRPSARRGPGGFPSSRASSAACRCFHISRLPSLVVRETRFMKLFPALRNELRHQRRPASLVTGPDPHSVVSAEVFGEGNQVPPMRVLLKFPCASVDRAPAVRPSQKDVREPARQLGDHVTQGCQAAGAGGIFHLEAIAQ